MPSFRVHVSIPTYYFADISAPDLETAKKWSASLPDMEYFHMESGSGDAEVFQVTPSPDYIGLDDIDYILDSEGEALEREP